MATNVCVVKNLAYRQTEIKWSFCLKHLNSWFAGIHENHENWYSTNKNEFTVLHNSDVVDTRIDEIMYICLQWISREGSKYITIYKWSAYILQTTEKFTEASHGTL